MMILVSLAVFFGIVGMGFPPLLFLSAFFAYLAYSRTARGVRAIRAAEKRRAAKVANREYHQALRYFS